MKPAMPRLGRLAAVAALFALTSFAPLAACMATFTSSLAAIALSWTLEDETCESAGVERVAVTATSDDGTTTARWFPCEANGGDIFVPAGTVRLVLEGVDGDGDARYTAGVTVDAQARRELHLEAIALAEQKSTGDLVVHVLFDALCARGGLPSALLILVDGMLAAPPTEGMLCGVGARVLLFELEPGPHVVTVFGVDAGSETLFAEEVTTEVFPDAIAVIAIEVDGVTTLPPPPSPPNGDDRDDDDDDRNDDDGRNDDDDDRDGDDDRDDDDDRDEREEPALPKVRAVWKWR